MPFLFVKDDWAEVVIRSLSMKADGRSSLTAGGLAIIITAEEQHYYNHKRKIGNKGASLQMRLMKY